MLGKRIWESVKSKQDVKFVALMDGLKPSRRFLGASYQAGVLRPLIKELHLGEDEDEPLTWDKNWDSRIGPAQEGEELHDRMMKIVRWCLARLSDKYAEFAHRTTEALNYSNPEDEGRTILHVAVQDNKRRILESLVEDPRVDINKRDADGETPLIYAAGVKDPEFFEILRQAQVRREAALKDFQDKFSSLGQSLVNVIWARRAVGDLRGRGIPSYMPPPIKDFPEWRMPWTLGAPLDIEAISEYGTSALWTCACVGSVRVAGTLIAYLKDPVSTLALKKTKGYLAGASALDVGQENHAMRDLLALFKAHPKETQFRLRLKLGLPSVVAASWFAHVVFVSDGLLQPRAADPTQDQGAQRFVRLAQRLPLELQMVLCNRIVGLPKDYVSQSETDGALCYLAHSLNVLSA
jgi:hypothetical protein